jgi:hypothetical protein
MAICSLETALPRKALSIVAVGSGPARALTDSTTSLPAVASRLAVPFTPVSTWKRMGYQGQRLHHCRRGHQGWRGNPNRGRYSDRRRLWHLRRPECARRRLGRLRPYHCPAKTDRVD